MKSGRWSFFALAEVALAMSGYAAPVKKTVQPAVKKDPVLVALEQAAKKQHNRAVVIDKTARQYSPETRPELIVREARQSYQERLHAARKAVKAEAEARLVAEEDARRAKELQKSAKRAGKNRDKVGKTLEHAKKKAASEDEAAVYQGILDILSISQE